MCRCLRVLIFTAAGCAVLAAGLWAATSQPADASFRDASFQDASTGPVVFTDMIRSDNLVDVNPWQYGDGVNCVKSGVSTNQYFFRSITYGCTPVEARAVTLDFSQRVSGTCPGIVYDAYAGGSLDTCGSNVVPDVRIVATKMFASSALASGTPVLLVFSNPTNFSGPGGFELDFEQNVGVTGSATVRQMTTPWKAVNAIAELYQKVPNGHKVSLGRYYMPFSLVVQKLQ